MSSAFDYIRSSKYNHRETFTMAIQLYDPDIVNFIMYDLYRYQPDETYDDTSSMQNHRNGQIEFRDSLIGRYNSCMITGDESDICEACHIIPYNEYKNYDIDNGLLLTASLHKLFDKYALTIDAETHEVMIRDVVLHKNYERYNGKKVVNISKKTEEYLLHHNEKYLELCNSM